MFKGSQIIKSSSRMFWLQKQLQSSQYMTLTQRSFASGGHGHHHDDHHDDHGDHHDDHGHGHHEHVEKPALDHKFLDDSNSNKKFIVFNGLQPTEPGVIVLENPFRHHNDLKLSNGYPGGHSWEEEGNIHDEPYGYELGDDEQGQLVYPYLLLFVGFTCFAHLLHAHFYFDNRKTGEVLYHQRLTANQIEDEIRRIREEDAELRGHKRA
ncbi:UNKNOWN [Stylonychia lemnae]|uniref:Uncharacterized protein n=1 Tax=Stylonychia lemnae TaxID=5949 RepID=A0A078B9X7_STYLE|nr:UNKNOWN [Stylonychia lemnae]|eukprot:CDW90072.1 UNKNOWN [Stylonychia lemnae]